MTTVSFSIANLSRGSAPETFDVLIEADPKLAVKKIVVVLGLPAGKAKDFKVTMPASANCFDPDCTVRVTADESDAVPETNEKNNVDTATRIG